MKFATLRDGSRDGLLLLVSRDLRTACHAADIVPTLQAALERWDAVAPLLEARYRRLNQREVPGAFAFDTAQVAAPLPRAYQFIDASAFLNHGAIMERAFKLTVKKDQAVPILIQRQGDDFYGPRDDYPFPDEADNGDFEGEVAVVLGDVPQGTRAADALDHVRLLMLLNDMSMRTHLFRELAMGFGFIQAKPATVFGPVAVTPDELGASWRDGRVHLDLQVSRNGAWFGNPNGGEMDFSFADIIAHIAYNRRLGAGTVIGSGTFSNHDHRTAGSACLAERRALEIIDHGAPATPFLRFGDTLRFEMLGADGVSVFGAIEHRLVSSGRDGAGVAP